MSLGVVVAEDQRNLNNSVFDRGYEIGKERLIGNVIGAGSKNKIQM